MSTDITQARSSDFQDSQTSFDRTVRIPGIQLGRELGRGGMAVVLEGLDLAFKVPRRVAVKLMDPDLGSDQGFRSRFEREASMMAASEDDSIVRVYSYGEAAGVQYIVMEYLSGGTLAEQITRGPLSLPRALSVASGLTDALIYLHSKGLVHRDFKPGNVLLTSEGKPKLADFGIAKAAFVTDAALTSHSVVMGAPRYMSPEQARGESVDEKSDIYSFGITLLDLFAMRRLERHVPLRRLSEGKPINRQFKPCPQLGELICRCLMADPAERPTAKECKQRLANAAQHVERRPSYTRGIVVGSVAAVMIAVSTPWLRHTLAPSASPTIDSARVAALYRSLGIDAAQAKADDSRTSVLETLRTAPRHVTLGSNPSEMRAAFDLCSHYSSDCSTQMYADEVPRERTLRPFELDRTAVTVGNFRHFVDATGYRSDAEISGVAYAFAENRLRPEPGGTWRNGVGTKTPADAKAVVGVSFRDAQQYCRWKNARLPTEDEWEYAARGPERRMFPWGDEITPALVDSAEQPSATDGPRGGINQAYYGLSGHVWEWVDGSETAGKQVLKGGSWRESNPANRRAAARRVQATHVDDEAGSIPFADAISGFRCARSSSTWPDADFWTARL